MPISTRKFYNLISPIYPFINIFLEPHKSALIKEINKLPLGSLLDIGVGNGKHLKQLKTHQITGIDVSKKMLQLAAKNKTKNTTLLLMDATSLQFKNNTFDYVILSHIIAVVPNPNSVLNEVFRVLKPNGKVFILNHFTPNNLLQYVDKTFNTFSGIFHFKSAFYLRSLTSLKQFNCCEEIKLGTFAYYQLIIYQKP